MRGVDFQGLAILAGVALVAYVGWRAWRAAPAAIDAARGAAAQAADWVNPASSGNVVHGAVSSAGAAVTGQADWTLGTWLAEVFSPEVRAVNEMNRTAPAVRAPGWGGAAPVPDRVRGGW